MLEESTAHTGHSLPKPLFDRQRWLRRLQTLVAATGITAAALLFLPPDLLGQWRLQRLVEQHQPVLALLMIAAGCYFCGHLVKSIQVMFQELLGRRFRIRRARFKLSRLDREERAVLREFFIQRATVLQMPASEPVIYRLVESAVLTPMGEIEQYGQQYTRYVLSDEAKPFITSQALRLPVSGLTDEQLQFLKATRPDFILKLLRLRRRHQGI